MYDGEDASWQAALDLRYRRSGSRSVVASRHHGPLRVQKALYPEGDAICHSVVLHPPGGIAGGDALDLSVTVERDTHALITTPGATRWYKANGRRSTQTLSLTVEGRLEWLPQEAIVFDDARAHSNIDIALGREARMIGWDIIVLGRQRSGECFASGSFAQTLRLTIDGELAWIDRIRVTGGDDLLDSPIGLAGHHVFGCLWAAGIEFDESCLDDVAARCGDAVEAAPLTRLAPTLAVARALGSSAERVRAALETVWTALRPRLFARAAVRPRLWAT